MGLPGTASYGSACAISATLAFVPGMRGHSAYQTRVAGAGDITVVRPWPAETYKVGSEVTYQGLRHFVLADKGSDVELGVPEHAMPTRGGAPINIPSGNTSIVSKADLVIAAMFGELKKEKQT